MEKIQRLNYLERERKMAADIEKTLESILDRMNLIETGDIPNIDLYMDQVTTFMESHLGNLKRNPEDKVLTKTMINNYAKNELLPSPDKKKYSKNHVLLLTFIYYFKNVLSISDIKTLMKNVTEGHFYQDSSPNLEDIYREVVKFQPEIIDMVRQDLTEKTVLSRSTFQETAGEEGELLRQFSLLCLLSFDVYIKKTLIEAVIDSIGETEQEKEKKPKEK